MILCRSQGASTALEPLQHAKQLDGSRARHSRGQPAKLAAPATSSDLAAAQALAELRHDNDDDSEDWSDMACEGGCGDRPRRGGLGYNGIFRVTKPPLPLWVTGKLSSWSAFVSSHLTPRLTSYACSHGVQGFVSFQDVYSLMQVSMHGGNNICPAYMVWCVHMHITPCHCVISARLQHRLDQTHYRVACSIACSTCAMSMLW